MQLTFAVVGGIRTADLFCLSDLYILQQRRYHCPDLPHLVQLTSLLMVVSCSVGAKLEVIAEGYHSSRQHPQPTQSIQIQLISLPTLLDIKHQKQRLAVL